MHEPLKTDNLINFVISKLNCTEDEAIEFICDYREAEVLDIGCRNVNKFIDTFDKSVDLLPIKNTVLSAIGEAVEKGHLRDSDIKKLIQELIPEAFPSDSNKDLFNGKMIVPHIKDTAEPSSKRCNATLCRVVIYNDDFIYLENQVDKCMYVIPVSDFE